MIAMRNTQGAGTGTDVLGIYRVDYFVSGFDGLLIDVFDEGEKTFPTDASGNFNAGSSFWIAHNGDLIVYKMPHHNSGPSLEDPTVPFVEHSTFRGSWAGTYVHSCMAHVQLYTAPNLDDSTILNNSIGVDAVDELYENYRMLSAVDPQGTMGDSVSSVAWTLPVGCSALLWENPDWSGKLLRLTGTKNPEWYDDLSAIAWTSGSGNPNNKISSIQFEGACPDRHYFLAPDSEFSINQIINLMDADTGCAVLKVYPGSYNVSVTINDPLEIRPVDGTVVLGTL